MLSAYWLAKFYRCDPDVFLAKTPEDIAMHFQETQRLIAMLNKRG